MDKAELKKKILKAVTAVYSGININEEEVSIEKSNLPEFDWTCNIGFILSCRLKKSPGEIAEKIWDYLLENWERYLDKVGLQGSQEAGYINFKISNRYWHEKLAEILDKGKDFGSLDLGKNQKVQVEFISANPTGPLTLANGRGGYGGDALANLLAKAGWQVQREYYVNDGGHQVFILGQSVLAAAGITTFQDGFYRGEYVEEWAKGHPELIERFKSDPNELGKVAAKDIFESHIKPAIKKMDIKMDHYFSEAEMIEAGEVEQALKFFKEKELTYESEGAVWFKTTKFGDDKDRVMVKSDGQLTYFASDAAYHWDKFAKRKFDQVINFWGADHHGYVGRMQAAVDAMGFENKLSIVIMQLVRLIKEGQEFKMSKRAGTYVTIDQLFQLIGASDASDVARYFFLSRDFDTHMDFDLDLAKDTSEKNPVYYVKYAYARINGILVNAKKELQDIEFDFKKDLDFIKTKEEIDLIRSLVYLPELVEEVSLNPKYPVHKFTYYVYEVAEKFHRFYQAQKVITEAPETTKARLALVMAVKNVLEVAAQDILGLTLPEKM